MARAEVPIRLSGAPGLAGVAGLSGAGVRVLEALGAGSAGQVFAVELGGQRYALKVGSAASREPLATEAERLALCASRLEGFGLCVLEALAAGTPAVVSREPPFTEYLDERTACFVDPGSVESIAEGLKRTLSDGPFAARLRANGLRLSAQFSWSAVAEAHVLHYRALLAGRPPALAALAPS